MKIIYTESMKVCCGLELRLRRSPLESESPFIIIKLALKEDLWKVDRPTMNLCTRNL